MTYQDQLNAIRAKMLEANVDAYIIPSSDPHMSEYVPDRYKCIHFASGFTGSAGTLVITADFAGLWADFRYFEQAEAQLNGSGYDLVKLKVQHTPEYIDWLIDVLPAGAQVGFDYQLMSAALGEEIENALAISRIAVRDLDIIDEIWTDRPALPQKKAFLLPEKDCGQSFESKLSDIRTVLVKQRSDVHIISSLDDLAWLFNLRGNDVNYNPVVLCYALITPNEITLYIDENKLSLTDLKILQNRGVEIKSYHEIKTDLSTLSNCSVLIDEKRTCYQFLSIFSSSVNVIKSINPTVYLKSVKNSVEIENIKLAMIQDGVALTRFFKWLEENIGKIKITEISASEKIKAFRESGEGFAGLSFASIAGYGLHAALPHYCPNEDSDIELKPEGLFLLDSGGHYFYGTTDVTRTVPLGKTTAEEQRDYTLVLSAMIFGSAAKFPQGTRGYQLDGIVRQQMWQQGINYGHGTGHGVGYYLNVHEGPQNIGPSNAAFSVDLGMLTSIEPGIYRPGKHGVRIENLVITVPAESTDFGDFLQFDTATLCYIDTSIVLSHLLLPQQIEWLNRYNQKVYDGLKSYLNADELTWLAGKCKAI
ncbi:aminopeptidase P family protein [Pedobacter sp. MC2016-05]|uniref:aminopeptidase P family protein n=1 Tax=Pedobacter sp. MC2016-05 TaxID=2994474 RepID=UPI002245514C|nr:aminopeptidase P family protein [Pedobacter sp. MC2016-05]MCX2476273.1 aminopeptidase P family protein [Pedobacter sp. MC2016-05]